jgi:predicted ester cyclase
MTIRKLVSRFYARLWNAWDDAAVEHVLAGNFTFRGTLGNETVGRDGWRAYRDEIRRGASDLTNEIVDVVTDGEQAAARMRHTGTHRGRLLGLAATGRAFIYDGAAILPRAVRPTRQRLGAGRS